MSHPEQRGFFQAVAEANRPVVGAGKVLEIGSYSVNGDVRSMFAGAGEYVGVDLTPGPNVDRVGYGHEVADPDGSFDVAISGECFEHDPYWGQTLSNMVRLTRPGGLVAFTCASRGRVEHGTSRSLVRDSPGTQSVGLDYYLNLTEEDVQLLPLDSWFSQWRTWYNPSSCDLYFAGVRHGATDSDAPSAALPSEESIARLGHLMPAAHRAVRLPVKLLARTRISEERFQSTVLPYWRLMLRVAGERGLRDQPVVG